MLLRLLIQLERYILYLAPSHLFEQNPLLNVMKVDKAPLESYADIGGLED